ncbi:hypothetical protein [Nocardioides ultimimeridianus]
MNDWRPRCTPPRDLVAPAAIDPAGQAGPTRHQARRGRWERVAHNLYVPAGTDRSRVEQRIVEQAGRVAADGAVTGWAALRMWGAAFFDGTTHAGAAVLPVPLVSSHHLADTPDSTASRAAATGIWIVAGVRVVSPAAALYAELLRRDAQGPTDQLRAMVAAIDMACAAPVTSLRRFGEWLDRRGPVSRRVRTALAHASEHAVSPPEVEMRMTWTLDAGWPAPQVNRDVFDLEGRFIGRPDLMDPVHGVFGEYNGALHRARDRYRSDVARMERLREHGLEGFVVVAGDGPQVQLDRMAAARGRALRRPASDRRWTLDPPQGRARPFTADEILDAWGLPT